MPLLIALLLCVSVSLHALAEPAPDTPFRQEVTTKYPLGEVVGDMRSIGVNGTQVFVGYTEGAALFDSSTGTWTNLATLGLPALPVFSILPQGDSVYLAVGDGLYVYGGGKLEHILKTKTPLSALTAEGDDVIAAGPDQLFRIRGGKAKAIKTERLARGVRALAVPAEGALWLGTSMGLYDLSGDTPRLHQTKEEIFTSNVFDIAADQQGRVWAATLGGVNVFENGALAKTYGTADGIPNAWMTAIAMDTEGGVWVGTRGGAARWDGTRWAVRHSQRWLSDDEVIDIAPDDAGGVWVATRSGISHITAQTMTLAEKAAYFEKVSDERHVREPGFVEKIRLATPVDLSKWVPEDDDNDGEYTSQYLAAQAFRWKATGDPDAKAKAQRSWKALVFLQTITGTSGFIARTAIPKDWEPLHDPNVKFSPADLALSAVDEPRYKSVEERWRLSADGVWKWKGDTSSDEITGHYSAFGIYYDLVAEEAEKPAIRDHVARVTDHLIENDYTLVDSDGTHTYWGMWSPEKLKNDPDWYIDHTINSTEMLGYLLTAWHITGDEKYRKHYLDLAHNHGYLENARNAKNYAPAWITHIDDTLLVLSYRALLAYETDPAIKAVYQESVEHWYKGISNEQNPWFNYCMGIYTGTERQREDSLFFLRDCPVDLIAYSVMNRQREDLTIVRTPILEDLQTSRLLPPSERATVRWDKNPWKADDGHGGISEFAPTFWLVAYWMGRAGEFVAGP
jgi:hypothetical protein